MAIFHCDIKVISRGKSKSAVASSAYRSGTKMTNEYDGEIHDYTRKGGIHSSAILLPSHAPKEYADLKKREYLDEKDTAMTIFDYKDDET